MAEEDLISKKELLEKYKISYGALYRWKRKGLIPEEWFIRKSTQTGQETFFQRKAICERIEAIIKLKEQDNVSLEDIKDIFFPKNNGTAKLIIDSKYGKHIFDFSELTAVTVEKSSGSNEEILDLLKEKSL